MQKTYWPFSWKLQFSTINITVSLLLDKSAALNLWGMLCFFEHSNVQLREKKCPPKRTSLSGEKREIAKAFDDGRAVPFVEELESDCWLSG